MWPDVTRGWELILHPALDPRLSIQSRCFLLPIIKKARPCLCTLLRGLAGNSGASHKFKEPAGIGKPCRRNGVGDQAQMG